MSQRILVIDDEAPIQRSLRIALEAAGFEVLLAGDGQAALETFRRQMPELLLLDLGLPDVSGLELLKRVRELSRVPVIILSVRDQERQKVEALDLGANDYLTKPFGMQELLARIRAALRNSPERLTQQADVYRQGALCVERSSHRVIKHGQLIKLTKTEYKLLDLLIEHAGKVLSHRQILAEIWGDAYLSETHYLQVYVSQLRRKLEDEPTQPQLILTEAGVGYRLSSEA
ncbi:MAG: DNA-binding response regulator [Candidatus Melainabacteria bacterium HGW-Melainabacteria-1]|nr:MAG: DNA-binding response regulator [Candidatus Melainabacteria bacterium HGW-Melainabacteria-1]